jgi:long-chain acyl-CoA synthetase
MARGASTKRGPRTAAVDGIVRAFDQHAARRRDAGLILSPAWQLTVGDVDDWSHAVADIARRARLAPGSVVGLLAPGGPAFLAGVLGLRRARCTVLLLDGAAPSADTGRALAALGARAVLHAREEATSGRVSAHLEAIAGAATEPGPIDRAVIKLTSGSTGAPRGVAVSTDALLADEDALARTMGLRGDDRLLAAVPMSHSYGFTTLVLSALVRGLPLITRADAGPFAPLTAAERCGATIFPTVPAYLQAVLRVAQPPPWPAGIRRFITAGAPLPPATAAQFRDVAGRSVHVFYGSSECGGICYDRAGDAGERGTVGTPVDGVAISLAPVDDEPGHGLLTVRSAAVGETYLPEPDSRLGSGRFQTADLAAWRAGEIALVRRVDHVVNVRGFKVDPAEVEQVIAALPGVDEVAVTGMSPDDGIGSVLRAVVACRPGSIDAAQIAAWCRPRLAEHKVPRSIVLVETLPRNARGKIDRTALSAVPVTTASRLEPEGLD